MRGTPSFPRFAAARPTPRLELNQADSAAVVVTDENIGDSGNAVDETTCAG